jgi:lipopolysaccharide export system protein LptA
MGVLFVYGQKVRNIDYTADYVEGIKINGENVNKCMGNAVFRDSATTMYCDSAYFYKNKDIDAFGNIRIYPNRSATVLTGKSLHYNAELRLANISRDVVLVDEKSTLRTEILYYDVKTGLANYPNKGVIVSGETNITSNTGIFNSNLNTFYFKNKVVVVNPSYLIHTDTMNYITTSKVVEFQGPTIITSKDDSIYCESGWYDTKTDISTFRKNAWLKGSGRVIKGDTLYYEKLTGYGKGFGNVELWDTTQNIIIRGNYAIVDRPAQIAIVTKKALMIWVDKTDSLYLHADTIRTGLTIEKKQLSGSDTLDLNAISLTKDSVTPNKGLHLANTDSLLSKKDSILVKKDSIMVNKDSVLAKPDSLLVNTDSISVNNLSITDVTKRPETYTVDTFKFVKAYHHVKFFKSNFQGLCDSMFYSFKDSTLELIGAPVLWSDKNQMTAQKAKLFTKNQKMDRLEMNIQSFIISKEDSIHFNQIKGKNMVGFFKDNELVKLVVKGNGQSIYFPIDQGEVSGINKTESSTIHIFFKNRQLSRITYINSVDGGISPLDKFPENELKLKDFIWHNERRPLKWQDVFVW